MMFKVPLEVILHPVTDLQFNHFGGVRLHVSTCGHAMHVKCHANVMATIRTNSHNRAHYEGSQVCICVNVYTMYLHICVVMFI
jgi:hypothetical protein